MIRATDYQSYMIRLWRECGDEAWRATAQSTDTGWVYQFASLEALFTFLRTGEHQAGEPAAAQAAQETGKQYAGRAAR